MSLSSSFGRVTTALVRAIDPSLVQAALRLTPTAKGEEVCLKTAQQQHDNLVNILRTECGIPEVYELSSGGYADSVFIEDTAVAIGPNVLVTTPGAESRQGEVIDVRNRLKQLDGVKVASMEKLDPEARMDGGDVMFTGYELIVGISSRTNAAGADAIQEAFPNVPVRTVDIQQFGDTSLHLKFVNDGCVSTNNIGFD